MSNWGNKQTFAIEWEPINQQSPFYGYMRFWAGGCPIGNFDESVRAFTARSNMRAFTSRQEERSICELDDASAEEVFLELYDNGMVIVRPSETLEDALMRPPRKNTDYHQDAWRRDTFHLDEIGGAAFRDHVGVILVNNLKSGCERLIWRDVSTFKISEQKFPLGTVEKVFEMFVDGTCD